jgi:hypothetical protein
VKIATRLQHATIFRVILGLIVGLVLLSKSGFAGELIATNGIPEFRAVDIFIDSKGEPLAAYQLEWKIRSGGGRIVGIEGGEHPAFKEAPFYDPKAIQQERAILAGFKVTDGDHLPKGKTRIATIHIQTTAGLVCEYKVEQATAASTNGGRIPIEASSRERTIP